MRSRMLGAQLEVAEIGLGCAVMSGTYRTADEAESIATVRRAIELGVTLFDTSDSYGSGHNEVLIGKALARHRSDVVLSSKSDLTHRPDDGVEINGRPEYVRTACEASLRRLGTDHLDLYYLHRVDPRVPVAVTVAAMADLVTAGLVRHIGLCEVDSVTLRQAHSVYPITSLESEWSLFSRGLESETLATALALGVGIVAYSPLARGLLSGSLGGSLAEDDLRRRIPRFRGEDLRHNERLVSRISAFASEKGCTAAQVALAWLLNKSDVVVPIPGAECRAYLEENAGASAVTLSPAEMCTLESIGEPVGSRLPEIDYVSVSHADESSATRRAK